MGFDVQTDITRRKGPGKLTFVAVMVILVVQVALLAVFQYIQSGNEESDVLMAAVHVQERETTSPVQQQEDPDEPVPLMRQDEPRPAPVVDTTPKESEEDLVNLLRDIEADAAKPPPKESEAVASGEGVFGALTGAKKPEKEPEKTKKRPKQVRMAKKPAPMREKMIKIVSVEQNRFPASPESDEMRILNISLTGVEGAKNIRGGDVALKVTFYDEVGDSGMTIPSRVQTSLNPIRLKNRRWKENATYVVTATYVVPKGFRDDYRAKTGARMKYYGYIVELYYDGELQDLRARPKKLMNHLR